MILTFLYMIATSIQSRRIFFLRSQLRNLFQETTNNSPSIMLYKRRSLDTLKEPNCQADIACEDVDKFLSCCLCANKSNARLGELLWYNGDTRLCTIYPQQTVDISSWLVYENGKTFFPLYTNECSRTFLESKYKIHVLVEADLESYKSTIAVNGTKLEDYGSIIAWTANQNINVILESDLDTVTKFFTVAMGGQCYINNGLMLKRLETILLSGKPCFYSNDMLKSSSDKIFLGKVDWQAHMQNLRSLSNMAKLASEECKPIEVPEISGLMIYPEGAPTDSTTPIADRTASIESLNKSAKSVNESRASTPATLFEEPLENPKHSTAEDSKPDDKTPLNRSGEKLCEKVESQREIETEVANEREVLKEEASRAAVNDVPKGTKSAAKSSLSESMAKLYAKSSKPPNVLVYADSVVAVNNVKSVLEEALGRDKYVIYPLSLEDVRSNVWMKNAALVVVCGNVGGEIGSKIVEYILLGGKLLALCSDVLHILLPSFKTAEVRENELVHFSYGKWKHVRMMHHIFCYQASPIRTRFSQDHEDVKVSSLHPPASANFKDKQGKLHSFDVKVLGTEETWHTPSILLASLPGIGGKVVFSQIHLEVDPMQYELEESKFTALKESNKARLEIFTDLLEKHLGIEIATSPPGNITYTPAFFLGRHELKLEMLETLKDIIQSNDILKLSKMEVQFCRGSAVCKPASSKFLPIMVHQCPDNFSTIEYFENLSTYELGRLVIYTDVMTSSMDVLDGRRLHHGLAVITRQQTRGRGRGRNVWLSPEGCAMFTMQLHVPTKSPLGTRTSSLQHLAICAIVSAIKSLPGYEEIDLRIKWPNDIYAGNTIKIGGILITCQIDSGINICNIGVGVNLFNSSPSCCINDLVKAYNEAHRKKLPMITYEQYFAIAFNEIEKLLTTVQNGDIDAFIKLYYQHWMHTGAEVEVVSSSGKSQQAVVLGIDEYGFLRVRGENGSTFTVHPDGNSFDPLSGLIRPK